MTQILQLIPEVPVREDWEWLTNVLVSNDGTEQRIALRGAPRVAHNPSFKMTTQKDLRKFASSILTGRNEFWLPEYQYATRTSAATLAGSSRLYYDPDYTDLRVGEHILISEEVFEIDILHSDGCGLTVNLTSDLPKNSRIAPVGKVVIEDNTSLSRYAVDEVAETSVTAISNKARTTVTRTGTTLSYSLWASIPILDVRPLADTNPTDALVSNQIVIDNKTGPVSLVNEWLQPKVTMARQFIVDRTPPTNPCSTDARRDMDYWRHFLEYCRGSARKFWMPTFRPDLISEGVVSDGASNLLVDGKEYADDIHPLMETHRYLEVLTASGTHRCEVTSSSIEGQNSRCHITPSLPSGWTDIERISYLLPVRLDGDSVEWEHYARYSLLNMNIRIAE